MENFVRNSNEPKNKKPRKLTEAIVYLLVTIITAANLVMIIQAIDRRNEIIGEFHGTHNARFMINRDTSRNTIRAVEGRIYFNFFQESGLVGTMYTIKYRAHGRGEYVIVKDKYIISENGFSSNFIYLSSTDKAARFDIMIIKHNNFEHETFITFEWFVDTVE